MSLLAQQGSLRVAAPGVPPWDLHGETGELIPVPGRWAAAEKVPKLRIMWPTLPIPGDPPGLGQITFGERFLCTDGA